MNINIEAVIALVLQTKDIINNHDDAKKITVKGQADFVTQVDTSVQQYLKDALHKLYPDIQFVGEEDHLNIIDPQRPAWILDPVDGTTNLIYDFRHSAVSLGYYQNGQIDFGVVYNPFSNELFHAVRGKGAYLNSTPIHCSLKDKLIDSLISIGTSPYDKDMARTNFEIFRNIFENSLDIRRTGAASLDLAYVACGRLEGYFERNLKPWDFAAGAIILEEAGGQITSNAGTPVNYCMNQDILATNGAIHDELEKYLTY